MFGHRYFGRYFGARYFGPAADEAAAHTATFAVTEGADDAAFTAKITINARLNVSPLLGFTADSTEITADDTGHTADEDGLFDPSRGEGTDTFAGTVRVGDAAAPPVDGGSTFDPFLYALRARRPAPVEATFSATEGADSVSVAVQVLARAKLSATEGADSVSAAVVVSISARMAAVEGGDVVQVTVAVNESLADDEIMALLLAEAA